jgi:hypothetical protein
VSNVLVKVHFYVDEIIRVINVDFNAADQLLSFSYTGERKNSAIGEYISHLWPS